MLKAFFSDLDKAHYNLRHLIAVNTGDTFRYRTKANPADAIGIANTPLLRKMKGSSEFTLSELLSLFRLLHATESDVYKIFCIPKTSQRDLDYSEMPGKERSGTGSRTETAGLSNFKIKNGGNENV